MASESRTLSQVINLLQISVTEFHARTTMIAEDLPPIPPQLFLEVEASGHDHPEKNVLEVVATLCVFAKPQSEDEDEEPPLDIRATYRILYGRPPDFVPTNEELQDFARNNGVFNAWPYWRELTHSFYGRMNLPFPPLPVFRVGAGIHREGAAPDVGQGEE